MATVILRKVRAWVLLAALAASLVSRQASAFASAHPPLPTVGLVKVTAPQSIQPPTVTVTIIHDALAFALNDTSKAVGDQAMHALLNAPDDELRAAFDDGLARMKVGLRLEADGKTLPFEVTDAPSVTSVKQWLADHPDRRLPCKLDFVVRATLPPGTKAITCRFPEILSDVLVIIERPDQENAEFPLAPAETSPPLDVSAATARSSPGSGGAGEGDRRFGRADEGVSSSAPSPDIGPLALSWRYIEFGFRHIIPDGPDHALFVLGLFLLSPRIKPVLWQITAFTIAHTVTLTLTTLHIIGLPSSIVEPTIALSIAFIGIENLITTKVHPWRPAVAFLFGLVHGMGVATAFNEVGFPPGRLVPSLAAFTVGVEGGHLAVLAAAFLLLAWSRDKPWYRKRVAIPLSCLISVTALFWAVQRIFF